MGESPEIPSTLSEEGVDFVECCLFHDPTERWTATELIQHHNFCKVRLSNYLFLIKSLLSLNSNNFYRLLSEMNAIAKTTKRLKRIKLRLNKSLKYFT